jgi:hypothetical protein
MREEIPLNEAELAAVDDGVTALEKLLENLADSGGSYSTTTAGRRARPN